MMLPPNPDVLDTMIRDRQSQLRTNGTRAPGISSAVRVRVGHALIAAGNALIGEKVERPARRTAVSRAA